MPETNIAVQAYLDYFQFDIAEQTDIRWERIEHDSIAVFVYTPVNPVATAVCIHGYLNHSGTSALLVNSLLSHSIRVVCADLPGHGLSEGKSFDIGSFHEYGDFVDIVTRYCTDRWNDPLYYIAHSTGCAAMIDYLLRYDSPYNKVVFLAPLVRSWLWDLSMFGTFTMGWCLRSVPAARGPFSRDKDLVQRLKADKLRGKSVPISWVKALDRWNKFLKKCDVREETEFLVIQGTADTAVDAAYGKKFFDRVFPSHEYITM